MHKATQQPKKKLSSCTLCRSVDHHGRREENEISRRWRAATERNHGGTHARDSSRITDRFGWPRAIDRGDGQGKRSERQCDRSSAESNQTAKGKQICSRLGICVCGVRTSTVIPRKTSRETSRCRAPPCDGGDDGGRDLAETPPPLQLPLPPSSRSGGPAAAASSLLTSSYPPMAPAAVLLCLHDHAADAPPGNAPALLPSIARARQFTIDRDDAENREANGLGSFRSVAFT